MHARIRRLRLLSLVPLLALAACGETADTGEMEEAPAADTAAPAPGMEAESPQADGLLDPNEATEEQLVAIQGIDADLASTLIAGRPYDDMLAVDSVLAGSLDEAEREEVYRYLWKRISLNDASEEEILLIPGVGDRMAHEFDEYRPYDGIERFRREIGKYVDEEEVARLEQYVEIR